jgi:hypothetical protein
MLGVVEGGVLGVGNGMGGLTLEGGGSVLSN